MRPRRAIKRNVLLRQGTCQSASKRFLIVDKSLKIIAFRRLSVRQIAIKSPCFQRFVDVRHKHKTRPNFKFFKSSSGLLMQIMTVLEAHAKDVYRIGMTRCIAFVKTFFGKQNKKRAYGRLRFPKPRSAETFRSTAISFEGCLAPEKAAFRALLPAFFLRQIRREFAAHRILHFRLQLFNALGALEFFLRILLGFLGEFMRSDVATRECVRHGAC